MIQEAQKCFCSILFGITQHQKGYLVYAPHKRQIVSSYNIVFDEIFSSELAYISQLYAESMAVWTAVPYIPYATSSKENTGDIITFTNFEEGDLLSEICNDTESGNKYDTN